jgi:hypothetical protein
MRDTLRLRATLHLALAAFPLGAALPPLMAVAEPAPDVQSADEVPAPPLPPPTDRPQPPLPMPPSCPSGEVTLTLTQAQAVAALDKPTPDDRVEAPFLGCPPLPHGVPPDLIPEDDRSLAGYSFWVIDHDKTQAARDAGEDTCVYDWVMPCPGGRLLAEGTEHIVAQTVPGAAWSDPGTLQRAHDLAQEVADAPALRRWLAQAWLDDARIEHASIASFARSVLELMRLGAPPSLIAATQRAGLDEVRHAQRCFALAAAYSDASLQPGTLDAPQVRALDLPSLAVTTFLEGCVGETIGTLAAERSLAGCSVSAVRDALTEIAHDERDHAALAWATVRWAIQAGGPTVCAALRDAAAAAAPAPNISRHVEDPDDLSPDHQRILARHGRLTPSALHQVTADAWAEVITPTLTALGVSTAASPC